MIRFNHSVSDFQKDNKYKCQDCYRVFTRRDNMTRHWKQMHETSNAAYPPPPGAPPPPQGAPPPPRRDSGLPGASTPPSILSMTDSRDAPTILFHPFTMVISGPTGKLFHDISLEILCILKCKEKQAVKITLKKKKIRFESLRHSCISKFKYSEMVCSK